MWTFYVCAPPQLTCVFSPPGYNKLLRDLCQSDLPLLCFLVLCSLWPLRNPPKPSIGFDLTWRSWNPLTSVAANMLCESGRFAPPPEPLRMSESKTSAFGWVAYGWKKKCFSLILRSSKLHHCFVWLAIVVWNSLKQSSLISAIASPLLSPVPLSSTGTLCRLTSLLLIHVAFSLTSSHSVFFFSFAALRNQLFCIYFIAIWAFSDLIFLNFSSPPSSFHLFLFVCLGVAFKVHPLFWCIFHIQTRANI